MIEINTPAILFPAISLLMLAYTNRYLAVASLIRKLHSDYVAGNEGSETLDSCKSQVPQVFQD